MEKNGTIGGIIISGSRWSYFVAISRDLGVVGMKFLCYFMDCYELCVDPQYPHYIVNKMQHHYFIRQF